MAILLLQLFYMFTMKILPLNPSQIFQKNSFKHSLTLSNPQTKDVDYSANSLTANYNLAFSGLFSKDVTPKYDATRLTFEHRMQPNTPYLVASDSQFSLGGFRINLQNEYERNLIQNLKAGDSLIFGREGIFILGMNDGVSRQHLKIDKTKDNRLIATDLGSLNGTTILQNIEVPNVYAGKFTLQPQKKYQLPKNSVFDIEGYTLNLTDFSEEISKMQDKNHKDFSVFKQIPLRIEKYGDSLIAQNLSYSVNTTFLYLDETPFQNDFSQIYAPALLQKNVPTLIPQNAHLRLGKELTIDTRDKKINDLLDKKRKIVIGRRPDCDYIVNGFNDQVSNRHLMLERTSKGLVVTDLGSTNSTSVIPQGHMKAFYNEINGVSLKQGNIGDCTLLSALYSLSLNPRGQQLIKDMVSVDNDGSYIVQFPDAKPIKVAINDLYGQTNNKGEQKHSVESELGIRAIERAYARYLNRYGSYGPTMFCVIDKGAHLSTPLYNLTQIYPKTTKTNNTNIDYLFQNIVSTGGTNNHVITCATPEKGRFGEYVDYQRRFITSHAYSIKNINVNQRMVEIINPHNTKYSFVLGFDEFAKYFSEVCDLQL